MNNTITYKEYRIRLLRNQYTNRVRGAIILSLDMHCDTLAQAKRIIDNMTVSTDK